MTPNARKTSATIRPRLTLMFLAALVLFLPALPAQAQAKMRAQAKAQYQRAQQIRQSLEAEPKDTRTLTEYKRAVEAYRKVYLITSASEEVTPALMAAAELYNDMGDLFDPIYYQSSLVTYKFLLHEYPGSRYRAEALFAMGEIEKNDLRDPVESKNDFEEFLRRFPHSPKAADAREELAAIAAARNRKERAPAVAEESAPEQSPAPQDTGGAASVTNIRAWNAEDYTRVVVDLNGAVKYQAARIRNPDRIYFDLYKARLSPGFTDKKLSVENGFLRAVRVAQNKTGVVRLVLDVESVKGYSAFLLPDPYRLVIDVHGVTASASRKNPAHTRSENLAGDRETRSAEAETASARNPAPSDSTLATRGARVTPPTEPRPMRGGERTLTRALGLKIRRIVIDPGHGGYDTGTIGPHGVMEKNVCLDIALRLGRLIKQRLPGAKVIYTRKTDVFVPLEERTAIANQAHADLFISIHANSSHDRAARGVETYYLNFTTSPEALEVASRENALSDSSIHQLQDLIKKIARNDKVEESRELATDIQDSLTQRLRQVSTAERNRGVKKAPFVVLIGANMPSVLAEISFLSNPTDERMLEMPAQRERIAKGLFRGVENYLESLNSLNYDRHRLLTDRRPVSADAARNQK